MSHENENVATDPFMFDAISEVLHILKYLGNNSQDQGLCFILESCEARLELVKQGLANER